MKYRICVGFFFDDLLTTIKSKTPKITFTLRKKLKKMFDTLIDSCQRTISKSTFLAFYYITYM